MFCAGKRLEREREGGRRRSVQPLDVVDRNHDRLAVCEQLERRRGRQLPGSVSPLAHRIRPRPGGPSRARVAVGRPAQARRRRARPRAGRPVPGVPDPELHLRRPRGRTSEPAFPRGFDPGEPERRLPDSRLSQPAHEPPSSQARPAQPRRARSERSSSSLPRTSTPATSPLRALEPDRLCAMPSQRCDAEVILDIVFDRGLLFLVVANTGDRPAHSVGSSSTRRSAASAGRRRCGGLRSFAGSNSSRRTSRSRSSSTAAHRLSPGKSRRSSPPRSLGGRPPASGDRAPSTTTSRSTAISASSTGRFPKVAVQRDNPYLNFNFLVDLGLGDELGFSEVEVPSGEIEVIEYREGGDRVNSARKLPALTKYPNVTLKRGITGRTGPLRVVEIGSGWPGPAPERRHHAARRAASKPVLRWHLRERVPREDRVGPSLECERQRGRDRDPRARTRGTRDRVALTAGMRAGLPAPASRSRGSGCGSRARRPRAARGRRRRRLLMSASTCRHRSTAVAFSACQRLDAVQPARSTSAVSARLLGVDVVAQRRARHRLPARLARQRDDPLAQPVQLEPVAEREVDGRHRLDVEPGRRRDLDEIEASGRAPPGARRAPRAPAERPAARTPRRALGPRLRARRRRAVAGSASASAAAPGREARDRRRDVERPRRLRRSQRVARSSRIRALSSIAICVCGGDAAVERLDLRPQARAGRRPRAPPRRRGRRPAPARRSPRRAGRRRSSRPG